MADSESELEARRAIERTARDSYNKLVAYLAVRSHDVVAAEDALADAFERAMQAWPQTGIPERRESWLLTAARRRLIDSARHRRVQVEAVPTLLTLVDEAQDMAIANDLFPDERLKLLFICSHPAIDARIRTPLMLQTVLGLDAARIASAFVVQPSAMGQRLARAKAKIRDAGVAFEIRRSGSCRSVFPPCWTPSTRPMAAAGTTWRVLTHAAGGWPLKRSNSVGCFAA